MRVLVLVRPADEVESGHEATELVRALGFSDVPWDELAERLDAMEEGEGRRHPGDTVIVALPHTALRAFVVKADRVAERNSACLCSPKAWRQRWPWVSAFRVGGITLALSGESMRA